MGNEIDLVEQQGQRLFPVEIKSADTLRSDFFKNLELFQKLSGARPEDCYLIYQGTENQDRSNGRVRGCRSFDRGVSAFCRLNGIENQPLAIFLLALLISILLHCETLKFLPK